MPEQTPNAGQTAVIIVAAGRGSRAGSGAPKQYRQLLGKPVIVRTLEVFLSAFKGFEPAAVIVPVIHADDRELYRLCVDGIEGIAEPVVGGTTRQQSVRNALEHLAENPPEYVQIHDAARPFVTEGLITSLFSIVDEGTPAAVPTRAVVDTLVRKSGTSQLEAVSRDHLYTVQTPQVFKYEDILAAHRAAGHTNYTDDASVFTAGGGEVTFVEGLEGNFKITTAADFQKAERLLSSDCTDVRVGSGYDVHRFEAGTSVWLCGVEVPHHQKLKGHSDADVALHALTDAILSGTADGDIGTHFPPSDEKWRGASSDRFLSYACGRVRDQAGVISHLSVTIICETPKIGPHTAVMRQRIADIAGVDIGRVSVQATTTEKLGFTGRGEGIAAQATATIKLPEGNAL